MSMGKKLTGALHVPVSALINCNIICNVHVYLPAVRSVVKRYLETKDVVICELVKRAVLLSCQPILKAHLKVWLFSDIVTNQRMKVITVWQLVVPHSLQIDGFQSKVDVH